MNKTYKYTLTAHEKKEISFDTGVARIALTNANGEDGGSGVTYTAGENIQISEENVISATDTTYTAGSGIEISEQNVISNTAKGNTDIIAEEYSEEKTYHYGDYAIHNGKLYKYTSSSPQIGLEGFVKLNCETKINTNSPYRSSHFVNNSTTIDCYCTITGDGLVFVSKEPVSFDWEHWRYSDTELEYTHQHSTIINTAVINGCAYYQHAGVYYGNNEYTPKNQQSVVYNTMLEAMQTFVAFLGNEFNPSNWQEITVMNEIKPLKVYSTTEQVVGKWIDGRDVYEITLTLSQNITLSDSSWTQIPFNETEPSNIDKLIDAIFTGTVPNNSSLRFYYNNGHICGASNRSEIIYVGATIIFRYVKVVTP